MQLPVLSHSAPGAADLMRMFAQTERVWARHLGEETVLDFGTAIRSVELPNVYDANLLLDAALPPGFSAEQAFEAVTAHFAEAGQRCWAWSPNVSADAAQIAPLRQYLLERNYRHQLTDVLHRQAVKAIPAVPRPDLQIIPARASYRHARALAEEATRSHGEPQLVDARLLHVDDPHVDALLALEDGRAVGGLAVLSVGEIGRIDDVFVLESHRRRGIGRTLMVRALEIAARALLRHIFLSCHGSNEPAMSLYKSFGFTRIGAIEAFYAPP